MLAQSDTLSILPVPSLGSGSSANQIRAGSLNWASRSARKAASVVRVEPALLAIDHRRRHFAEPLVGDAEHRGLGHRGMGVDRRLDLLRADILAAADDDVLLAVDDEQIAVLVEIADVAGPEITDRR